jgi:hypothetical protein
MVLPVKITDDDVVNDKNFVSFVAKFFVAETTTRNENNRRKLDSKIPNHVGLQTSILFIQNSSFLILILGELDPIVLPCVQPNAIRFKTTVPMQLFKAKSVLWEVLYLVPSSNEQS